MNRKFFFLLAPGIAAALILFGNGQPSGATAQEAGMRSSGSLVAFQAVERLSNPQAWQTNDAGEIRFCYVITEVSNEEGESFYLADFQMKCTNWHPAGDMAAAEDSVAGQ